MNIFKSTVMIGIIVLCTTTNSYSQVNFKKVFASELSSQNYADYVGSEACVDYLETSLESDFGYFVASSTRLNFYTFSALSDLDNDGILNYLDNDIDGDGLNNDLDDDVDNNGDINDQAALGAFIKLSRFDIDHNLVWESTYGFLSSDGEFIYGDANISAIEVLESDQSIIVAGRVISEYAGIVNRFIVKFDMFGDLIWEKSLADEYHIYCLKEKFSTDNIGFLAAGGFLDNGVESGLILNFDNNGNILDSKIVSDDYYQNGSAQFRDIAENPITIACADSDCNNLTLYTFVGTANASSSIGGNDDLDILLTLYYADDEPDNAGYNPDIVYNTTLGKNIDFNLDETYYESAHVVFVPEDFVLNLETEVDDLPENYGLIIGGSYAIKDAQTCTFPSLYASMGISFLPFYDIVNWSKIYQLSDYTLSTASEDGSEFIVDIIAHEDGYSFLGNVQIINNDWDGYLMNVYHDGTANPSTATSFGRESNLLKDNLKTIFRVNDKNILFGSTKNYITSQFNNANQINNSGISYLIEYDPLFSEYCDDNTRDITTLDIDMPLGEPEFMDIEAEIWVTSWFSRIESVTVESIICENSVVSINEPSIGDCHYSLFPNPSSDYISIKSDFHSFGETQLNVVNSIGQVVFSEKYNTDNGLNLELETGIYSSGLYSFEFVNAYKSYIHKVLIH